MDWSGGRVVADSGDGGGGSGRQGTAGAELGGGGGGKAFGIVTENEASPLPLNKALKGSRRATGLISL